MLESSLDSHDFSRDDDDFDTKEYQKRFTDLNNQITLQLKTFKTLQKSQI